MPRLDDDLSAVTLDLHGATVAQAVALLQATVRLAVQRGRSRVRVIHGHSTSHSDAPTIKQALEDLLADRALPEVSGVVREGGATVLGLPVGAQRDSRRITLADVW